MNAPACEKHCTTRMTCDALPVSAKIHLTPSWSTQTCTQDICAPDKHKNSYNVHKEHMLHAYSIHVEIYRLIHLYSSMHTWLMLSIDRLYNHREDLLTQGPLGIISIVMGREGWSLFQFSRQFCSTVGLPQNPALLTIFTPTPLYLLLK